MPAPFLIAPLLIALSLIGEPGVTGKDPTAKAPPATVQAEIKTPATLDEPALEQPLSGVSVQLECFAYADGRVGDCVVVQETRPGLGFGAAAVALMNGTTVGPEVQMDQATKVKFRHTIEFTPD